MTKNEMIEINKFNKADLSGVYWLTACMAKNDLRFHLNHIQAKDNKLCATDGNRLHYFEPEQKFTDGFYRVTKRTKTVIQLIFEPFESGMYPDISELVNINSDDSKMTIFGKNDIDTEYASQMTTKIIKMMENNTVNFSFVMDVLRCDDAFEVYQSKDHNNPVKFRSENKTAIIMPLMVA